ncbi:hypothetical protein CAPTEDRAFT_212075 [Capitella teleta]|uniref:Uncharacterized protein n=1 Tax=Capitella teleta TaxID=283909 RepID=R7VEY0_CAPTE|nr:hypothetical protein CAPTEDRAFT_212075 [Capitella teleta]|eukprot:ELU17142.1 hypothetical protein CAPTEDRAFT_212075 [Capitella teleta]
MILELKRDNARLQRNIGLHIEKNDMSLRCVIPTIYDGVLYFEDYYAQFLTIAAHHGWDDTIKGIVLHSHLEGKALSVAGACNTFVEMVDALSEACGREKGDAAVLKLQSRCQKQGESLEEFSIDIVGLVCCAYSSADAHTLSKITIDAFINSIDDPTVRYLCDYIQNLHDRLEDAYRIVWENLQVATERNNAFVKTHGKPFRKIDLSWVVEKRRKKEECPKLTPKWRGPFLVRRILNDVLVEVQIFARKSCVYHTDLLKHCFSNDLMTYPFG